MSFQINRGLAKFDCVDHHAILGVPINAEADAVRKRYLKIARSLHPDSRAEVDKQLASQLLSKFVNPAYEKLSQARDRAEHEILLRMLGQRATQEKRSIKLQTELAQQLLQASDPATFYKTAVQDLAAKQYQHQLLEQAVELIGQLSELNLAYLMVREGEGNQHHRNLVATGDATTLPTASGDFNNNPENSTSSSTDTFVSQYYRRAEAFLAKNNFPEAMMELREALKLEPNNSRCHSLMGTIYLKQHQTTMARIHFNQALKADPKDSMALSGRSQLDKVDPKAKSKGSMAPKRGGGLFGLFGGKKS